MIAKHNTGVIPGSLTYVVSEFRPSVPGMRAHWRNVLTTMDKAEAEEMKRALGKAGRIETFKRRVKK